MQVFRILKAHRASITGGVGFFYADIEWTVQRGLREAYLRRGSQVHSLCSRAQSVCMMSGRHASHTRQLDRER